MALPYYELGEEAAQNSMDAHGELWEPQDVYSFMANMYREDGNPKWPMNFADLTAAEQLEFVTGYYGR